jgi:tetratricopeptide (TPR) repeat protein
MRQIVLLILIAVCSQGCVIPGIDGPVSRSLTASRQLSLRGVAAMEQGRDEEARSLLAKAVKACPEDTEARRHYAESLWRCGRRDEAKVQLSTAAEALDEDPSLRVRVAQMHLETGQAQLALHNAEAAIDLNPKLADGWAVRGDVMLSTGQFEEALADYHRALGYAPNDRKILLQIARLYHQTNRPDRELATLQSLADSYSPGEEPQDVLRRLGAAMVAMGRYDDGIQTLTTALDRGNPTPEILYNLSEAEMSVGNLDRATLAARESLSLQPNHQPSRQILDRLETATRPDATLQR